MLLWVVFQVNLTFVTLQDLQRAMRKRQGPLPACRRLYCRNL